MLQDLQTDCGSNIVQQSHKNQFSQRDFDIFTLMVKNCDIPDQLSNYIGPSITPVIDFYLSGITELQSHICLKETSVHTFKKHLPSNQQEKADDKEEDGEVEEGNPNNDEESNASCDI